MMSKDLPRVPLGKPCPDCKRPGGFPHIRGCPQIGKT